MRAFPLLLITTLLALPACAAAPEGDPATISLTSPAYGEGEMIPARFTADGKDLHPPYRMNGVPEEARSLALLMEDPDAPAGTWVHWVVWNLPPDLRELPEGSLPSGAVEGLNSWGRKGYGGPSPPGGTHRYILELYALDTRLELPPSTTAAGLRKAVAGHVLARGRLMGRYRR